MRKLLNTLLCIVMGLCFCSVFVSCSHSKNSEDISQYTVTFDSAGGTEIASQEVVEGNKVVRPTTPAKKSTQDEEYEFSGWYEGDRLWKFEQDTVSENITLTARWVTKKCTGDLPIRR